MSVLTWEEVLERDDLIGGDIESQEDGAVYRGPLSDITRDGDIITFESPWCARLDPDEAVWRKWNITSCFVNVTASRPTDIGDGRVMFPLPMLGHCVIFPKGDSQLDPANVEGLEVEA